MGKIRIKKIGFPREEKQKQKVDKEEEAPKAKKTTRVPGLKGGERIKAVEGVVIEEAPEKPKVVEEPKEKKKLPKIKGRGKRYQKAVKLIDKNKSYPLDEAIELTKKTSYCSFPATMEAHFNLYPKFLGTRGTVVLPYGTGKKTIVLVFGEGAENSRADIIGNQSLVNKISGGWTDFDVVLATPKWMPALAKVAKVLGPKGLMPNPKAQTVTENLKEAVERFKSGQVTLKTESKNPLIHQVVGKVDWPTEKLRENILVLASAIGHSKIRKLTVTSTMGPGVKVEVASLKA